MLLNGFHKIGGDDKKTILRHAKEGHEIHINHATLPPAHLAMLKAMPKLADGGAYEPTSEDKRKEIQQGFNGATKTPNPKPSPTPTSTVAPQSAITTLSDGAMMFADYEDEVPEKPATPADIGLEKEQPAEEQEQPAGTFADKIAATAPVQVAEDDVPGDSAPAAPKPDQTPLPQDKEIPRETGLPGPDLELQGVRHKQEADSAVAQKGASDYKRAGADLAKSGKSFEDWGNEIKGHIQSLQKSISEGKIDPNRYVHNMSTGSKIATAIGLLLGGIGGGLTHQENPAMKFLQKNIDNDIESQKEELGNKRSLLSANMELLRSLPAAAEMTRGQKQLALAFKIQQTAAEQGSLKAKSEAEMQSGLLLTQANQSLNAAHALAYVSGPQDPSKPLPPGWEQALPPQQQKDLVHLPNGEVRLALPGAAENVRKELQETSNIQQQLSAFKDFVKAKGRTFPGTTANAEAETMRRSIVLSLNKLHGLNRLTDTEYHEFLKQVNSPGAWFQDRSLAKVDHLENLLKQKVHSTLQANLVGYNEVAPGERMKSPEAEAYKAQLRKKFQ